MVVVPALEAVAIPVDMPIDATDVALLLQVPPDVALVNVVVCPTQMVLVPAIVSTPAFTVTTAVVEHPDPVV